MNMTAEVAYEDVADKKLENLRKDVKPIHTQLEKVNLYTS